MEALIYSNSSIGLIAPWKHVLVLHLENSSLLLVQCLTLRINIAQLYICFVRKPVNRAYNALHFLRISHFLHPKYLLFYALVGTILFNALPISFYIDRTIIPNEFSIIESKRIESNRTDKPYNIQCQKFWMLFIHRRMRIAYIIASIDRCLSPPYLSRFSLDRFLPILFPCLLISRYRFARISIYFALIVFGLSLDIFRSYTDEHTHI